LKSISFSSVSFINQSLPKNRWVW